jgi:segregation and condensation protein B
MPWRSWPRSSPLKVREVSNLRALPGVGRFEPIPVARMWCPRSSSFRTTRLSAAAIEALAIVAYLQPVSRRQIAEIRGVDSDSPVHTLLQRELITEVGRSPGAGGAVIYGTTVRFEAVFGLSDLRELPALESFALSDGQKEDLRRRLGLLAVAE